MTTLAVPKHLHLYWGIGDPLPYLNYLTIKTFSNLNPDWRISVWSDREYNDKKTWSSHEHTEKYVGKDFKEELGSIPGLTCRYIDETDVLLPAGLPEVKKSDIFRYFILHEDGGVYSDFDIFYLKALDTVITDFLRSRQHLSALTFNADYANISFMISTRGAPTFRRLYERCYRAADYDDYQAYGINFVRRCFRDFLALKTSFSDTDIFSLPNSLVHPFLWNQCDQIFEKDCRDSVPSSTVGIHWFNGSKEARRFLNSPNSTSTIGHLMETVK